MACCAPTTAACNWVFRHQLLMLLSTIALIVLTGYLYVIIPKGFIPQQDTGFIFGYAAGARRTPRSRPWRRSGTTVSRIITADPAVAGVVGFAGATGGNPSESTARMFIQLKPFGDAAADRGGDADGCGRRVAQVIGRQILHAGRAGRDDRRAGWSRRNTNTR